MNKKATALAVLFIILGIGFYIYFLSGPFKVRITEDSDISDFGFPGTGTESDPFVIENRFIITNLEIWGIGHCISISDTQAFFVIRNCILSADYIAIVLVNVASVLILSCTISDSDIGVLAHDCANITIINNVFRNCQTGFELNQPDYYLVDPNEYPGCDVSGHVSP
ncbi:MAG: right-handed parallel beta-helix repeat-containing protein [Candidatus Thorarchaeota archaeon]|jgi:parallel beta-helix repeat protein